MTVKKFIILILFFHCVFGQSQRHRHFYPHTTLQKALEQIENRFKVHFSYQSELVKDKFYNYKGQNLNLENLLSDIAKKFNLKFIRLQKGFFVIVSASEDITEQELKEVVINAYLTGGIKKNMDGSFSVFPAELGILAGLVEPDVLESIQQLPGVISPGETATNMSIRGGQPDQNLVYYDGIPIYQDGHLFGMISPFNPYVIKRVKYYFKGTPAKYEGGVSGIIDLSTGDKVSKNFKVSGGINALSTSLELEMPLINNRMSISASARTSYRKIWETPGLKLFENKVFENTNILSETVRLNNFGFNDWTLKFNSEWQPQQKLSISFIHTGSRLDFNHKILEFNDNIHQNNLNTTTDGLSITSQNTFNDRWQLKTVFDWTWYDLGFENKILKQNVKIGNIYKENFVSHTGISTDVSYKPDDDIHYNFGYAYNEKRSAYLFKLIADNQLYVFDYQKDKINTQALYGTVKFRHLHSWYINAGIRIPYYQEFRRLYVEPRLVVGKNILKYTKLQLTGEIKHQNIQQINKSVIGLLNLENKIWQVSDPGKFPIVSAGQMTAGLLFTPGKWHFELDFFTKQTKHINITVPYRIYNRQEYLTGNAATNGMDFYIKKKYDNFDFWASYSLMQSQYQFEGLKNNASFVSDYQIKHKTLTTLMYHRKNFQAVISWFWHSPRPYYKDIINDETDLENEPANINKDFDIAYLPAYSRVDLSAFYDWTPGYQKKYKIRCGFSIRNLFDRNNILSHEQNSYGLDTNLIDFERYGLNRFFNIVLRVNWKR